ncbi:MAG TPA: TonB-dependent receptor [Vicinamibacteria bacterium]|nr:TonB-dependent receptor [Vicinamibacteria bacterium]
MPAPPSSSCGEPARRPRRRRTAAILGALLILTGRVAAEDAPPPASDAFVTVGRACPTRPLDCAEGRIATRWEMEDLARDLPSGRGAWSLLETVEPAAVVDRIDGAGLHLDEPGRFSMRGTSWTQNALLLDGLDVTDPLRGGTSLVLPDVESAQSIEVTSALAPAEYSAPGVTLALASRAPPASWHGTAQAHGLGSGLQSRQSPGAPSIARFGSLVDVGALAGGPIAGERLRLVASLRLARVRRLERADEATLDARLASGLVQLAWRAGERDALRLGGVGQALERPLAARARFAGDPVTERTDALVATSAWSHEGDRVVASAFAGLWKGTVVPQTEGHAAEGTVDRLRDGPVPDLVFSSRSRRASWSAGGRLAFRPAPLGGLRHAPRFGVTASRASVVEAPGADGPVAETVGGLAARVWEYAWPGPDAQRHALDLAAWASERLAWRDRLFVEAGLRLERTSGSAKGAGQGVSWTSLLPRVSARLRLTDGGGLSLLGGWAEYRHRLRLDFLAFGDPSAPRASVYRWTDANGDGLYDPSERGPLVARVGPGDGSLAGIDPGLRPPRTRELVAGLEASPGKGWLLGLVGFDRRESDLVESVDVGVPTTDYVVRYVPDPSGDIDGPQDDQLLPVFDRKPESFGLDRYLLTNPPGDSGRHQGVELRVEKALGARLALFAGATASRTEVRGGNRGFRATENDQGVVGELFDDPNADTYSLGRGFFDRAYTIKVAAAWRAPRGFRLGLVVRYQDGQPFGRLVVVPDLAQGPEAIPATPRGQSFGRAATVDPEGRPLNADGHRFAYTLTVDARIEKGFRIGSRRLALVAEVFNLPGLGNEVEENPVWGASFRDPTAVQPPRVVRLGARFDF